MATPDISDLTKQLKDVMEVIEKLKGRRKEIKGLINREGQLDDDEDRFATELASVSSTILSMEKRRSKLYEEIKIWANKQKETAKES